MKHLRISVEGKTYDVEVELLDDHKTSTTPRSTSSRGSERAMTPIRKADPLQKKPVSDNTQTSVVSPLAAVVVLINVNVGDRVDEGQNVATLEAMKMNTMVVAPTSGTVKSILVATGDAVEEGQLILTFE